MLVKRIEDVLPFRVAGKRFVCHDLKVVKIKEMAFKFFVFILLKAF